MGSGYGCLYMPHFSAWAPHGGTIKSDIIAIDKGRVYSHSPDLSNRGLSFGDTTTKARALCPEARLIPRDRESEKDYSQLLIDHLLDITPQVRPITESPYPFWAFLQGFSKLGFEQLVGTLSAQGSYATSPTLAQLAALYAQPGNLCIIPPHEEPLLLKALPTHRLLALGFEQRTLDFLDILGFSNLFNAKKLTKKQMKAQFGPEGVRLYKLLHPPSLKTTIPYWRSQTCCAEVEITWECDTRQCEYALMELVKAVLAQENSITELIIKINDDAHLTARQSFTQPTRDDQFLHRCSTELFTKLSNQVEHIHRIELFVHLRNTPPTQGDLWQKPQWEHLRSTLVRRFPHKVYRPQLHSDYFLPEHSYTLSPLTHE